MGCELFRPSDLHEDFLRVLKDYKKKRTPPAVRELSPEQQSLKTRLQLMRRVRPEEFAEVETQVKLLSSRHPRVRRDALLRLGDLGEEAQRYLEFAFSFFSVEEPDEFDDFLMDPHDPALFHLVREAAFGMGEEAIRAEKALALIVPLKIRIFFLMGERGLDWSLVMRNSAEFATPAVEPLHRIASSPGRPEYVRRVAVKVLGNIRGDEAQAALFRLLRMPRGRLPGTLRFLILATVALGGSQNLAKRLEALVKVTHDSVRKDAAFLLAGVCRDPQVLLDLVKSDDPAVASAGILGLARLGTDVSPMMKDLPLVGSIAERNLAFLTSRPTLAPALAPYLADTAAEKRFAATALPLVARSGHPRTAALLLAGLSSSSDDVVVGAITGTTYFLPRNPTPVLLDAVRGKLESPRTAVVCAALKAVSACRDKAAGPFLAAILSRHPSLRAKTIGVMVAIYGYDSLGDIPLEIYLKDIPARIAMLDPLLRAGETGAWKEILHLLNLTTPTNRTAGLRRLYALGGTGDVKRVIGSFHDSSAVVASEALKVLTVIDPAKARPFVRDFLGQTQNPILYQSGLEAAALVEVDEEILASILAGTELDDGMLRRAAFRGLRGCSANAEVTARVRFALIEGHTGCRQEALRIMTGNHDRDAIPWIRLALCDAVPAVRIQALAVVERLLLTDLRAEVKTRLGDGNERVRVAAARTLAALGDRSAIDGLLRGLTSGHLHLRSDFPRWEALSLLGRRREALDAARADLAGADLPYALALIYLASGDMEAAVVDPGLAPGESEAHFPFPKQRGEENIPAQTLGPGSLNAYERRFSPR
jgi:HEAT repeat protein